MKKILIICISVLFLGISVLSAQERKKSKIDKVERQVNELKAALDLSEQQYEEVKKLYAERNEQLSNVEMNKAEDAPMTIEEKRAARGEYRKMRKQANEKIEKAMTEILNEDQMKKYRSHVEEKRNRRRMKVEEHDAGYNHENGIREYPEDH